MSRQLRVENRTLEQYVQFRKQNFGDSTNQARKRFQRHIEVQIYLDQLETQAIAVAKARGESEILALRDFQRWKRQMDDKDSAWAIKRLSKIHRENKARISDGLDKGLGQDGLGNPTDSTGGEGSSRDHHGIGSPTEPKDGEGSPPDVRTIVGVNPTQSETFLGQREEEPPKTSTAPVNNLSTPTNGKEEHQSPTAPVHLPNANRDDEHKDSSSESDSENSDS